MSDRQCALRQVELERTDAGGAPGPRDGCLGRAPRRPRAFPGAGHLNRAGPTSAHMNTSELRDYATVVAATVALLVFIFNTRSQYRSRRIENLTRFN